MPPISIMCSSNVPINHSVTEAANSQTQLTRKEICQKQYSDISTINGTKYCGAIDDGYLCWPPTLAGKTIYQKCPPERLSDTNKNAFRVCGPNGIWLNRKATECNPGWTNYTPCFPGDVRNLLTKVYDNEQDAQVKFDIAEKTRTLEIVGCSVSLPVLIISLAIFMYYRSLRNTRTRIHKSLFTAMIVQVIIRLTLYIDQALARNRIKDGVSSDAYWSIGNMPYLCEASYVLLEYAGTVMFLWMFIEGLYLHNMVTSNSLRSRWSHSTYFALGWGFPVVITGIWAMTSHFHYRQEPAISCWYGYNFTSLYWIVQGPRLAVIIINLVFLLNIMKVLIIKLRRIVSNDIVKVRKAVRAALVLLPLLGITNVLNMIEPPLNSVWLFALWSYTTHFLRSFQGFFIALIYCFMNGEVRGVLKKQYDDHMAMRAPARPGQTRPRGCNQRHQEQNSGTFFRNICCPRRSEPELPLDRPATPHPSYAVSETDVDVETPGESS
ncbi:PDF receptor isoform X2 [Amyelois transitella]|uniref:PDF receptor isoform X2 n=1 Tax=Amyelois transitella TaxID=680683 RepID=UPI00299076C3|nr:PDF receptor isoform X2 [Amyelois transitella]